MGDEGESEAEPAASPELAKAIDEAKRALADLGRTFDGLNADDIDLERWLEALASLGQASRTLQKPGKVIGKALGVNSATERMSAYFLLHLGEPVDNYALSGVAGTLEWARRVRELGLEEGWQITVGPAGGLERGQYRLDAEEVDAVKAERWRIRNAVRRLPGSGGSRCLEYLRRIYPGIATKDDLAYVARINEWPRRMRELAEAGWALVSSNDDPTLEPGSYRLESLEQGPARPARSIALRHEVLERDGWSCRRCGASTVSVPGTRLEVHHKRHIQHGGDNEVDNLVTLCSHCHAGVHSRENGMTADELLNPQRDPWRESGRPPSAPEETLPS